MASIFFIAWFGARREIVATTLLLSTGKSGADVFFADELASSQMSSRQGCAGYCGRRELNRERLLHRLDVHCGGERGQAINPRRKSEQVRTN
jgi:hypothetical protein